MHQKRETPGKNGRVGMPVISCSFGFQFCARSRPTDKTKRERKYITKSKKVASFVTSLALKRILKVVSTP